MSRYLMGLDAGTTSFKGAIYDEQGVLVAVHPLAYTLLTPQADWVEYPAEAYWNHFCELTRSLLEKSGVTARDIEALAISSQGETLVCLDEAGEPLGNAIVWLDNRAASEADALRQAFGRRALYEHTGQADMLATWPAAKILWLRENQPARFARVKRFLLLEDWLLYRLTGRFGGTGSDLQHHRRGHHAARFGVRNHRLLSGGQRHTARVCSLAGERLHHLSEPRGSRPLHCASVVSVGRNGVQMVCKGLLSGI